MTWRVSHKFSEWRDSTEIGCIMVYYKTQTEIQNFNADSEPRSSASFRSGRWSAKHMGLCCVHRTAQCITKTTSGSLICCYSYSDRLATFRLWVDTSADVLCFLPISRTVLKSCVDKTSELSVRYEGSIARAPGADLGSGQIVLDRTKFIGSCFILCLFFKCHHYIGQVPIVNYFYVPNSFWMKQTAPLRTLH